VKGNIQNPVVFVPFERELLEVFEEFVFRVALAVDVSDPGGVVENIEDRTDTLFASRVGVPVALQAIYVSRLSQIRISLNTL
jgi:hypothetical protein